MRSHTPGPWTLNRMGEKLATVSTGQVGLITVNCGTDSLANAALVTASPQLLRAAKMAAAALANCQDDTPEAEAYVALEHAIAHAEGRTCECDFSPFRSEEK